MPMRGKSETLLLQVICMFFDEAIDAYAEVLRLNVTDPLFRGKASFPNRKRPWDGHLRSNLPIFAPNGIVEFSCHVTTFRCSDPLSI